MGNNYRLLKNQDKIVSKDELTRLKINDFVFLIFEEDGKEERMWVKINNVEKNNSVFKGIVANQPIYLKSIKQNDEVSFTLDNINNFSTKEEQERIINEFKKTGKLPLKDKKVDFITIIEVIKKITELPKKYENGFVQLYKMKKVDLKFFEDNLSELREEYKSTLKRNRVKSRILTEDVYKIFLSLVLVLVLPQVSESLLNNKVERSVNAKNYYKDLYQLFVESKEIFHKIAPENISLLSEIRKFYNDEELNRIKNDDLPELFGVVIEETKEELAKLF